MFWADICACIIAFLGTIEVVLVDILLLGTLSAAIRAEHSWVGVVVTGVMFVCMNVAAVFMDMLVCTRLLPVVRAVLGV